MGLFRSKPAPAFGASQVKAAAGGAGRPGAFQFYSVGRSTERALSIPVVSRAIGLITSTIASLDLRTYTMQWDPGTEAYERLHGLACGRCGGQDAFRGAPNYIMYGQFVSPAFQRSRRTQS